MSEIFVLPTILKSFVSRRSTLGSGSPSSALRGITVPDAIVAGPLKRDAMSMTSPLASVAVAAMVIVLVADPFAARFRQFVPGFPYTAAAMLAANRLPDP